MRVRCFEHYNNENEMFFAVITVKKEMFCMTTDNFEGYLYLTVIKNNVTKMSKNIFFMQHVIYFFFR